MTRFRYARREEKSATTCASTENSATRCYRLASERKKLLDAEIAAEDDAELIAAVLIAVNEQNN